MKRILLSILLISVLFNLHSNAFADINTGLIAHYPLNNDFNDAAGNSHGTQSGGVGFTNGIAEVAALFDGVNDYVDIGSLGQAEYNEYTISLWVNTQPSSVTQNIINSYPVGYSQHNSMLFHVLRNSATTGESKFWFLHRDIDYTNGGNFEAGDSIFSKNKITEYISSSGYIHVAVVRNPADNSMKIYINGDLDNSLNGLTQGPVTQDDFWKIGKLNSSYEQFLNGALDEIRIYNRALSQEDVQQLYTNHIDIISSYVAPLIPNENEHTKNKIDCSMNNEVNSIKASPGPILAESGGFAHNHIDLRIPGLGLPLSITRYYNSQDFYDGPFGHGWNMNYTSRLVLSQSADGTNYATVHMGNGVRRKFDANTDGSFTAPTGHDDTLIEDTNGNYLMNGGCNSCPKKKGKAYRFRSDGTLDSIEDENGNQITIGYDVNGRVYTVTDANNRQLTFTYGTNNRVETISDFSTPARVWTYGYDANDNLTSVIDPSGNMIQYQYDSSHNMTDIIDALGNVRSTITYDSSDKAVSFTDNGGTYDVSYDPASKVTQKLNPANGLFAFNYDNNGNIINKTGPGNKDITYTWDANVDMESKTDSLGVKTSYTYDAMHNITSVTRDAGEGGLSLATQFSYDPATGKVSQIIDPLTNTTNMTYDAAGNMLTRQSPSGTTHFSYDSYGNMTQVTDPDNMVKAYEYDANGYLIRQYVPGTDPVIETTYTYDIRGNLLTVTDPTGVTTTYTYDVLDQLLTVKDDLDNTTSFDYDTNGNMVKMTNAGNIETVLDYDEFDRLVTKTEAFGTGLERRTSYTYDTRGNLLTVTDPMNRTTTYVYDELSRMVEARDALNQSWYFAYDAAGRQTAKTDPNGNTTSFAYDALGRLESVTDAENHVTSYTYDGNGRMLTIVDANGHTAATNTYDADGRMTSSKDALDNTTSFTYSPAGRVLTMTDANGQVTTYVYDAQTGRLSEIQYPAGRTETLSYDLAGRLLSISDSQTGLAVSYTYDALGRLATETQLGQDITYMYDLLGRRDTMDTAGIGIYQYAYDELNRLTSITNPQTETTTFEYNAAGLITRAGYFDDAATEYVYDAVYRLTDVGHTKSDGFLVDIYRYTYDAMNNRQSEMRARIGGTVTYTYDKTYKLLSATYPGETISYTYDGTGNRLSRTDNSGTVNYDYDDANRLMTEDLPDTSQVVYVYDDNGNIQSRTHGSDMTQYTYDIKDKLTGITLPGSSTVSYSYDPAGRRTRTQDSSGITRYFYDGQNPLADITGDDATPVFSTIYTPAMGLDSIISRRQGGVTQYFLRDGLNSVRDIMNRDENSLIVAEYEYNPYGAIRSQSGSSDNGLTFTGRRAENDTSLMFYRSRYYDPMTGRFLKKDSYKGSIADPLSLHRYGYVHGNPVNYVDPEGEVGVAAAGGLCAMGGAFGYGGYLFTSGNEFSWKGLGASAAGGVGVCAAGVAVASGAVGSALLAVKGTVAITAKAVGAKLSYIGRGIAGISHKGSALSDTLAAINAIKDVKEGLYAAYDILEALNAPQGHNDGSAASHYLSGQQGTFVPQYAQLSLNGYYHNYLLNESSMMCKE